ncbi:MAG: hypothetical protein Q8M76_14110 [Spirochaetaceae bacterium]|nr:hypothetical protein [Spirochaetaceae bacterium]
MKKTLLAIAVIVSSFPAWSLDLMPSKSLPVIDGALSAGEYAWSTGGAQLRLGLALSEDGSTLFVAVEAATSGWVSAGLGSKRMDGAHMVIGRAGLISEQDGRGHNHADSRQLRTVQSAVKTEGGKTTLEFSIPAAGYVVGGALDAIVAYGKGQGFSSMHAGKGSLRVTVK